MINWMSIWTWASWQWKQDKKTHTRERSLWLEKIEIDGITFHNFNHCIRYNKEVTESALDLRSIVFLHRLSPGGRFRLNVSAGSQKRQPRTGRERWVALCIKLQKKSKCRYCIWTNWTVRAFGRPADFWLPPHLLLHPPSWWKFWNRRGISRR